MTLHETDTVMAARYISVPLFRTCFKENSSIGSLSPVQPRLRGQFCPNWKINTAGKSSFDRNLD